MNLEIKKLTCELADEYVHFFDVTPHNDEGDGLKCYCVTWRSDDSYIGNGDHWFPTQKERRERAIQFVNSGSLQGYLAYCGNEIVGWCNANANCHQCINYLRLYWPIEECRAAIKVKSIFCFVISPQMQRMGVATKLLERVCHDAAADGFDYVEVYVNKDFTEGSDDFRGHPAMYEKCGFNIHAERESRIVMQKALK